MGRCRDGIDGWMDGWTDGAVSFYDVILPNMRPTDAMFICGRSQSAIYCVYSAHARGCGEACDELPAFYPNAISLCPRLDAVARTYWLHARDGCGIRRTP